MYPLHHKLGPPGAKIDNWLFCALTSESKDDARSAAKNMAEERQGGTRGQILRFDTLKSKLCNKIGEAIVCLTIVHHPCRLSVRAM